jgi:hypothetical protein
MGNSADISSDTPVLRERLAGFTGPQNLTPVGAYGLKNMFFLVRKIFYNVRRSSLSRHCWLKDHKIIPITGIKGSTKTITATISHKRNNPASAYLPTRVALFTLTSLMLYS